jgi:hypothetical protein
VDIADIPNLPSRAERFDAITVDCYGEDEMLSAFEVYLSDALRTPFAALWGAPGTERLPVTVLGSNSRAAAVWAASTSGRSRLVQRTWHRQAPECLAPF